MKTLLKTVKRFSSSISSTVLPYAANVALTAQADGKNGSTALQL